MNTSLVRRWASIALACASLGGAQATAAETRPPNVVIIVADDLGWADIGANNADCFYDTPRLDAMASQGARFTHGYAVNPVCSPTRYGLMTGRSPSRADVTNWFSGKRKGRFAGAPFNERMELEETTLAEALAPLGYASCFAGKWHLGPTEEFWPTRQGFDVNRGGWKRGGPYGGKKYFSPYGNPRLEDGPDGEHLPDRLAAETVNFMRDHRDQPFLAYLAFYSVHTPLMAPEDLVEKYRAKAAALPAVEEFGPEEQTLPIDKERRVRLVQRHAVYAGMVEAMDRAVGRVLDGLDDLGLADNTLVVFTSDHGGLSTSEGSPTSNLPFRGGKGWIYEGGLRVPFLVRWPGRVTPGSVIDTPVLSTDLMPTALEVAEGAIPAGLDGQSLVSTLRDGTPIDRDLYWHYPHYANQGGFPGGAITRGRWKLIERYEDGRVHLYDLEADIGEQHDVADQHPERVAEMRARLHAWYRDVDAKFLEPKDAESPAAWRPW